MLAKRNRNTISKHQGRNLFLLLEEGEKVVTGITSIDTRLRGQQGPLQLAGTIPAGVRPNGTYPDYLTTSDP
jgi:hypothetical protein